MHILRHADLGGRPIVLLGHLPHPGRALVDVFTLPAILRGTPPLTEADLVRGTVVVATLPSIQRNASVVRLVELEGVCAQRHPSARIVLVSQEESVQSNEVDCCRGRMSAASYTLSGASESSRVSFAWAFGVGVLGDQRIAHGLFALRDGVFVAADVPFDQMQLPDVSGVLTALDGALRSLGEFQEGECIR